MNTENMQTKLSLTGKNPHDLSFELYDISSIYHIASCITALYGYGAFDVFDFEYTFVPGKRDSVFAIHSKNPQHLVLKITPNYKKMYAAGLDSYSVNSLDSVRIEFYITSDYVLVYPTGMYPGCAIYKLYEVGYLCRTNTFVTSDACKEISEYVLSWNKCLEILNSLELSKREKSKERYNTEGGKNERTLAE